MKRFAFAGLGLAVILAAVLGPRMFRAAGADLVPAAAASPAVLEAPRPEFPLPASDPRWSWLKVAPARSQDERLVAVLPAQVALDEDRSVRVSSPVAGRVLSIEVHPGERVAQGQALAHLTSGDVGQAQSDLAKAEAAAAQTHAALARARELYDHHVIALKDLQQAQADDGQASAEADRAAARARQLGASRTVDQQFVLRAPVAGEVLERNLNPGAEVRPDDPNPLFVVSDLRHVWVTAALYPRDLGAVHTGDRAVFTTESAPGRAFNARVKWVSDQLDPQTRTATLRVELANADGALRSQVPGEVRVYASRAGAGAVVPTTAVVTHGSESRVIVEERPGVFRARSVQVGEDDGVNATLLAGIRPGERVVTKGSLLLAAEMEKARP